MNIKPLYYALLIFYIIFGSSKSASAETDAFLGPEWIVIGNNTRVEVKKDSIRREGNIVESEFAYFYFNDDRNFFMSVKGKRRDDCRFYGYPYPQTTTYGEPYPERINVLSARIYNEYYEGTKVEEVSLNPDDMESYIKRPNHSKMLHRFLCNNIIKPNLLKAGMDTTDAVDRLKKIGYKVIEQKPLSGILHNANICESSQPCLLCGVPFAGCYISMESNSSEYGINLRSSYGLSTLIDAEYTYGDILATDLLSSIPDDISFISQNFSQSLFRQIPWSWEKGCEAYELGQGPNSTCIYQRRYFFKNAVLTTNIQGTAGVSINLKLQEALSIEEATKYAKLFTNGFNFNFSSPYVNNENYIRYVDNPHDDIFLEQCDLIKNDMGKIKEINFFSSSI